MTDEVTVETVTIQFDVKLQYETKAGRAWTLKSIKQDHFIEFCGCSSDCGNYKAASVARTTRVVRKKKDCAGRKK